MVTRYRTPTHNEYGDEFTESISMEEVSNGDYVTYEDYEELWDDYCDAKNRYDVLVKKLGELYKES